MGAASAHLWDRPFPILETIVWSVARVRAVRLAPRTANYLLPAIYLVIAFATVFSRTNAESFPLNSMRFKRNEPSASCE